MYAPVRLSMQVVATSGLEMSQNAMHLSWSAAEVDEKPTPSCTEFMLNA